MNKIKKTISILLIVSLLLFIICNKALASSTASDPNDRFIPMRDTSVMEDPSLKPENYIEEPKSYNNETDLKGQNTYFAIGIVLLLVGASCALIIIKMTKNKKAKNKLK